MALINGTNESHRTVYRSCGGIRFLRNCVPQKSTPLRVRKEAFFEKNRSGQASLDTECVNRSLFLRRTAGTACRDMAFVTERQHRRHPVTPCITGSAQVNGRNNASWEQKIEYDLQYINNGITFESNANIIFRTIFKVVMVEDVVRNGTAVDTDFGDWLLENGKIAEEEFQQHQQEAIDFLYGSNCA